MADLAGESANVQVPAVKGDFTGTGDTYVHDGGTGVRGYSANGYGVHGISKVGRGVVASSETNYGLRAHSKTSAGARCSSDESRGLEGWSTKAEGVHGLSKTGTGVWGYSESGIGVLGDSKTNEGIRGVSHSAHGGVVGVNDSAPSGQPGAGGNGGWFESLQGEGVRGWSKNPHHGGVVGVNTAGGAGVYGTSDNSVGVWGTSVNHEGIHAETKSTSTAAIAAFQLNPTSESAALYAKHTGNRTAAFFEGNVIVTGDITLANADCAEDFDICAEACAEPGTVMALDDEGNLRESSRPYDKRVAGVISGAGNHKPALVLDKQQTSGNRQPIALMGKVFCKVDAQFGAIEVGDLLTTSPAPGHAMKTSDPIKAFGAVIGKALRPLKEGQGLIPILVALQ